MATSSISNTILDSLGAPVVACEATIELIPSPAFKTSGEELASKVNVLTDGTGKWTAVLERTVDITPSGTYYRATERIPKEKGGKKTWYFTVPVTTPTTLLPNTINPATASGVLSPFIVTSSTRPGTPFVGQMIFETDTGKVLFYYGTTLGWLPNWGTDWGEVARTAISADFSTSATAYTDVTGLTVAFTAILGRRYTAILRIDEELQTTATSYSTAIADAANTVLLERNTQLQGVPWIVPMEMTHRSSGSETGSVTRKARIKVGVGTGVAFVRSVSPRLSDITVYDVGAAAAPVIT